jgi:WD40 repeat protein
MPQFKPGDTVRTKSGGPLMTVDGYTANGEVVCTYWIKDSRKQDIRKQEHFVEATLEPCTPHETEVRHMAWHPEGHTLAVVGDDSRIYLWDVAAGKQGLILEGHKNQGIGVGFNQAGDLLASSGWEGMVRLWEPRTGRQLFSTPGGLNRPRFSPDDHLLAGHVSKSQLGLWEVAAGRQYRTLGRNPAVGKGSYFGPAIHPEGRLLAVGMEDGVGLWDLTGGKELAFLKSPGMNHVLFEPCGALLTNGEAGLFRWPVQGDPASAGLVRIGPPHKLSLPGSDCQIAISGDGRVIASAQYAGGLVLHSDHPDQPVRLSGHRDVRSIGVSRDGQWVATGSHNGTKVKIWQAETGHLTTTLPVETGSLATFSPDGRWLATSADGGRLWAVGSWQEGCATSAGSVAFSPDSKLLAVETGDAVVRLLDPQSGREYARLEDPNQDRAGFLCFSPDSTQLVTTNQDSQSIHVWDLGAIRGQLAEMGLDWELKMYPPPAQSAERRPLDVLVDLGVARNSVPD